MTSSKLIFTFLFWACFASLATASNLSKLNLPVTVTIPALQSLLQDFVSQTYGKSFLLLGERRDFDHGHLLIDSTGKPIAILYHTQEGVSFQHEPQGLLLDPSARNWIEWFDTHRIEDARRYLRQHYPDSASWDLFRL